MNNQFFVKYLHYLQQKKEAKGFTLIELLTVIICIGILSAIALPSFLNQANKAKFTEAISHGGAVNRAQQTYRITNPTFANDFNDLEVGIPSQTRHYEYEITGNSNKSTFTAMPKDNIALKGLVCVCFLLSDGTTICICCGTRSVTSQTPITMPSDNFTTGPTCPGPNMVQI